MTSEPAALTLTWTPRAAELADATIARNREVGGGGARAVLAVVLAALAAIMFTDRLTVALGVVLIVVALLLAFFRLTAPLLRRRWAAVLAANPALAETSAVTFDATGIHLASDRLTSSRSWSTFAAWSDTPAAVVLSTSETAAGHTLVVPHRAAVDGEEISALRRLVETHLGPAQGTGPGRTSRAWLTWGARVVVVACLVIPLGVGVARVHDQGGEWSLWPSEAPPLLTRDGVAYHREGGPTGRPVGVAGIDYTPGGGLVLIPWPPVSSAPAAELWVLDHTGVVRHYLAEPGGVVG